jgi:hypothetical protein
MRWAEGCRPPMGVGGGIGDVPPDPEPHCMREGAAPLDPLPCGLLVLPPPLVLSSPFPRGTAATTLDESCSSVPRRPVEGRASTSTTEEAGARRRQLISRRGAARARWRDCGRWREGKGEPTRDRERYAQESGRLTR